MAWIILEGLDRSGKSTVAKLYEQQGYKIVHFSAPDKKYSQPGYTGPSYCEDIIELLVSLSGQDVVLDRSHYGEKIWPLVYGRKTMISEDEYDILQEIEDQNATTKILMHDPDELSHWQRCVENKEPISVNQFKQARQLYYSMADKYGFQLKTKDDFLVKHEIILSNSDANAIQTSNDNKNIKELSVTIDNPKQGKGARPLSPEQIKLSQANAINEILSSRIVKKKGIEFDSIESKIRSFLNSELGVLLGTTPNLNNQQVQNNQLPFSKEEIVVLKTFINRIKEKKINS